MYEGEEYQYWKKVGALKEKLDLLSRVTEPATEQAASTLLDLHQTWANTNIVESKDLVHVMLQEVGVDVVTKRVLWVKPRPDYKPLFSILDGLRKEKITRMAS